MANVKDAKDNVRDLEDWKACYDDGAIPGWNIGTVNPALIKFGSDIAPQVSEGGARKRVFIPLCGMADDIAWFYRRGHEVVGVEVSSVAIETFSANHGIPLSRADTDQGARYTSMEEGPSAPRLTLLCCDLFSVTPGDLGGQFDVMWDRGSLVAINTADRPRYMQLVNALMKPASKIMLEVFDYDPTVYGGPPHCLSRETIDTLFSDFSSVELMEESLYKRPAVVKWGFPDGCPMKIYIITK